MKAIALPLVLTLATAGVAAAHTPAKAKAFSKSTTASEKKEAPARVEGEVVSTDLSADKLVLKTATGDETFMVKGKAAARLKGLTAGEKVVVKSRHNEVYSISTRTARTSKKHHS